MTAVETNVKNVLITDPSAIELTPTVAAPAPDVGGPSDEFFPARRPDFDTASSSEETSGPSSITLGGLGILLMCVVAVGIIGFMHFLRRR